MFLVPRAGHDSAGRHRDTPAHHSPRTRDGGFHGLGGSPRAAHVRSGDPASVKNKTHPKPGLGGLCLPPPSFLEPRESRGGEALLALQLRYIYYRAEAGNTFSVDSSLNWRGRELWVNPDWSLISRCM